MGHGFRESCGRDLEHRLRIVDGGLTCRVRLARPRILLDPSAPLILHFALSAAGTSLGGYRQFDGYRRPAAYENHSALKGLE